MFINKTENNRNNVCGEKIKILRKEQCISQRELADRLQILGLDMER